MIVPACVGCSQRQNTNRVLFDVILVDDTSRLSRRLADSLRIFEQMQSLGIRIVFVAQGIDTTNEQAELLVATHGIVDSLYIKDLAKRTFRGVEHLALNGLHTGGRVFGYRRVPIQSTTERDSYGRPKIEGVTLEVDPDQARTVRRIFERYSLGHSLKRSRSISTTIASFRRSHRREESRGVGVRLRCGTSSTTNDTAEWFSGAERRKSDPKPASASIGENRRVSGVEKKFPSNGSFPMNSGTQCGNACKP